MCVNKREKGMICLAGRNNVPMGAALESPFDRQNDVITNYHSLTINIHLSKIDTPPWYVIDGRHPRIRLAMACVSKVGRSVKYFMQSLYAFKNLKALAHDLIPASLCEGPFFYFYVESVFLFLLSSTSKHQCQFCATWVICNVLNLLYSFVLTISMR